MEKPEFEKIDQLFTDTLTRLENKKPQISDPYTQGPHSADHFLLKKSWDYFKDRVRAIEQHWQEIVGAKDAEIAALKEELYQVRQEMDDASAKTGMIDAFEQSVRETRTDDFIDFQKLSERLKDAWEEERQSLATQLSAVESALRAEREKMKRLEEAGLQRTRAQAAAFDQLKEENLKLQQKHFEDKGKAEGDLTAKDEEIQGRERKIDLLRQEMDLRDQVIAAHEKEMESLGTKVDALLLRIKETDESVAARDTVIKNLRADIERLEFEKASLKSAWQNEQAQWRELWERARSMWDAKNRGE